MTHAALKKVEDGACSINRLSLGLGSLVIDRRRRCAQQNDGGLLMFPWTRGLLCELICFQCVCLFIGTDPLYLILAMEW